VKVRAGIHAANASTGSPMHARNSKDINYIMEREILDIRIPKVKK